MPISLLDESNFVISFSFLNILPEVGVSIPINIFNKVVFPQPEGPRIDKNSPSFTSKLMLSKTVFLLYIKEVNYEKNIF